MGQWPAGDAGNALLQAIQALMDREPDPERKSRLGKLLVAVGAVGKDVLTQVATGVVKGLAGVP